MRVLVLTTLLLLTACAQTSFQDFGAKIDSALHGKSGEEQQGHNEELVQSTLQPLQSHYRLTIQTVPEDSTVKIMNIQPKYTDGIQLVPGRYDILVQNKGYEDFRTNLEITNRDRNELVKLVPHQADATQSQAIETTALTPSVAKKTSNSQPTTNSESEANKQSRKERYQALLEEQKNDPLYSRSSRNRTNTSAPAKINTSIASVDENNTPEFDGGYAEIGDGQYIEMDTKIASKTKLVEGNISIMGLMDKPYKYYVLDRNGMAKFSENQFQGIVLKGNHSFEHLSIHRLEEKYLEDGKIGLFENKGRARTGDTLYVPSQERFEFRMKSVGEDSYFFKPKQSLSRGDYVAWVSSNFWLFRVE